MLSKKKGLAVLASIFLVISMIPGLTLATGATDEIWVATTGSDTNPGTETAPFATIQAAITAAEAGDTIHVAAGEYIEAGQIVIGKNLTISGADKTTTIIKPDSDNINWIVVDAAVTNFTLSNVTLDGAGKNIRAAIRTYGKGSITNNIIQNIRHSQYNGWGIALTYSALGQVWNITGNEFINIERVGILSDGQGNQATISGNRFNGKGDGDWVEYEIEVGDGSHAIISGNTVTGYRGVALVDGSESAGIYVHSYFGPNPSAEITDNDIQYNSTGIYVGYYTTDTSVVTASKNNISNNVDSGVSTTGPQVNAANNWWGSFSGPYHSTNLMTSGNSVSDNVIFRPWLPKAEYTAQKRLFSPQENVVLQATVSNTDGSLLLQDASVKFLLDGAPVGTVVTGTNGVATLDIGPQARGSHMVIAEVTYNVAGSDVLFAAGSTVTVTDMFVDANNFDDAHDGNYNTSANIFSAGGYIIYNISDIGLTAGTTGLITLNAADGGTTTAGIGFLDAFGRLNATTGIGFTGYKAACTFEIPSYTVYIKIFGLPSSALYIFEIEENNATPGHTGFMNANNLDDAHDGNYNTSANIFSPGGYIIYNIDDIGLTTGAAKGRITLNAADGSTITAGIGFMDTAGYMIATMGLPLTGYKTSCIFDIPANTGFIKIFGLPSTALYIFEIETNTQPAGPALSVDANNFDDAHDGNINTSANIFSVNGYIIYNIADIGLTAGTDSMMTLNAADGSTNMVQIEFLNASFGAFDGRALIVSGYKGSYTFTIPAGAIHMKIYGIPSTSALYIYEIGVNTLPAGPARFVDANNFDDAHDGNINTSANIFTENGYIIYNIADIGLAAGTDARITLNSADGSTNMVQIEFLNATLGAFDGRALIVSGFKKGYAFSIPATAVYVKIYGVPATALYIYEIETNTAPAGPDRFLNANNLEHAYDGNINTSGNIFTLDGYIIYDVATIGLTAGADGQITLNAADGGADTVLVEFLDATFAPVAAGIPLSINGYKQPYTFPIPATAVYIKIHGIASNALYIYEINP